MKKQIHKTTFPQLNANNSYSYIPTLSLIKTSIVIGWFLVMCPWLNSHVSWLWCHCSVVARMLNRTARDQCMTKLKMVWSSAHAHISLIDNCEWRSCAVFVCLFYYMIVYGEFSLYNKALKEWSLAKSVSFVYPRVLMFPLTSSQEISGLFRKQNCFPLNHSLSVY